MKHVKHLEISEAVEWFGVSRNVPRNWIKEGKVSTVAGKGTQSAELIVVPVISLTPSGITNVKSFIKTAGRYGFIMETIQEYGKLREDINLKTAYMIDIVLCFGLDYGIYTKKYEFLRDARTPTSEFIAKYLSKGIKSISDITYMELKQVIERQRRLLKDLYPMINDYISRENRIAIPENILPGIMAVSRINDLEKLQFTADALNISYILKAHRCIRAKPAPYRSRYESEFDCVKKEFPYLPIDKYLYRLTCSCLDEHFSKYSAGTGRTCHVDHTHSIIPEFVFYLIGHGIIEFREKLNFRIDRLVSAGIKDIEKKISSYENEDSRKLLTRELEVATGISCRVLKDYLGIEWKKVACNVLKESAASFRLKKSRLHPKLLTLLNEYDKVVRPFNGDNIRSRHPVDTTGDGDDEGTGIEPVDTAGSEGGTPYCHEMDPEDLAFGDGEPGLACDVDGGESPGMSMELLCYYSCKVRNFTMDKIGRLTGLDEPAIRSAVESVERIIKEPATEEKDAFVETLEMMKDMERARKSITDART